MTRQALPRFRHTRAAFVYLRSRAEAVPGEWVRAEILDPHVGELLQAAWKVSFAEPKKASHRLAVAHEEAALAEPELFRLRQALYRCFTDLEITEEENRADRGIRVLRLSAPQPSLL